jgi:hypothetical protein
MDRVPAGELAGQIAPATPVFKHVQNAVQDLLQGPFAAPTDGNERLNPPPIGGPQVRRIFLYSHD